MTGISHGCTPDLIPQGLDFLSNPFAGRSIGAASGPSGFSRGFVLSNGTFSNEMSRLSCLTREIAIYLKASIISRTQHVLVRIADSSLGISSEELRIVLDTFSGFIRLTYNRQTQPHVETISIDGSVFLLRKWQQIVFLFSANQFVVIVDCAVRLSVTIPTPDLCFSSASTITVGDPGALSPSITFKVCRCAYSVMDDLKNKMAAICRVKHVFLRNHSCTFGIQLQTYTLFSFIHIRMYVCIMYVCTYVCIYNVMYVRMCICMYACMYNVRMCVRSIL